MILDPYVELYQGHVLSVLKDMKDCSVDMVMTSPPYWGLRAYKTEPQIWGGKNDCEHSWGELQQEHHAGQVEQTKWKNVEASGSGGREKSGQYCCKCDAWKGELGQEPTFKLYIDHLMQIFTEIKRVLKLSGTCWVNIGDSYASGTRKTQIKQSITNSTQDLPLEYSPSRDMPNFPSKSLIGIPERFAIAMTDHKWIRRNTIIWWKRNPMPESVKDRFTEDFEYLYLFSKQGKYFFAQQFEMFQSQPEDINKPRNKGAENFGKNALGNGLPAMSEGERDWYKFGQRNKRCVWDIVTEPNEMPHYASYPEKLCEIPILAGCPKNGIVLDPFCGTGTTLAVAKRLRYKSIGIELSDKYCKLVKQRISKISLPMELNI